MCVIFVKSEGVSRRVVSEGARVGAARKRRAGMWRGDILRPAFSPAEGC